MVEQVLNIDHNRFQSFKCICNDFAAVFVSTFKIISYCIKFCFLGDIQTYRMIHLSIFMYEVHGAKKEKKVTVPGLYLETQELSRYTLFCLDEIFCAL